MSINQGYNYPLAFGVSEDITEAESIRVQLTHSNGTVLKVWKAADLTINATADGKSVIIAPITQAESASWAYGRAWLDCSWVLNGLPKHGIRKAPVSIAHQNDTTVQGSDDPVTIVDQTIDTSLLPAPSEITAEMVRTALVVEVLGATDAQIKAAADAWLDAHVDEVKGPAGDTGPAGAAGADGYSPSAVVAQTATGATITITDKSGTTTATVKNGTDGAAGATGPQGPQGETGPAGPAGSDASVTATNIKNALGYTPADDAALTTVKADYAKKADSDSVYTKTAADELLNGKQDSITDLSTIRSGAEKGATALQSVPDTYRTAADEDTLLAAKEPKHTILSGTLVTGETALTFTDDAITDDALIYIYTDSWGVQPTAVSQSGTTLTLTFDAQSADLAVKVEVSG